MRSGGHFTKYWGGGGGGGGGKFFQHVCPKAFQCLFKALTYANLIIIIIIFNTLGLNFLTAGQAARSILKTLH
jgi:hypothetical protein